MAKHPDSWNGMGTAWAITSTLVAGILVWGAAGLLLDRLIWARSVFTAIGIVLGAAAGIYLVYLRYGRGDHGKG
jgi:F0F1-type ATP synthase assembly protein I